MLVQVSFAFTNISWFLSRMSCIFCVIKILVFSSMQFSRYNIKQEKLLLNGDGGIRTLDPLLARQVLSQLSYTPIQSGSHLLSHAVSSIVPSAA